MTRSGMKRAALAAGFCAMLGAVAVAPAGAEPAAVDQAGILKTHNTLRTKHGVKALSWSVPLAESSQAWAEGCAFEHSGSENGENLSWWSGEGFTQGGRVEDWYSEIKDYDFATGQSKTGEPVGHFTQIVWKSTTEVGCGVAQCEDGMMMVCQYSPAGNYDGEYQANVPPLVK